MHTEYDKSYVNEINVRAMNIWRILADYGGGGAPDLWFFIPKKAYFPLFFLAHFARDLDSNNTLIEIDPQTIDLYFQRQHFSVIFSPPPYPPNYGSATDKLDELWTIWN